MIKKNLMDRYEMDFKAEHRQIYSDNSNSPGSNADSVMMNQSSEETHFHTLPQVLDLSRRRDSMDMRKTPSPSGASSFSEGSPSITMSSSPKKGIDSGLLNLHQFLPRNFLNSANPTAPVVPMMTLNPYPSPKMELKDNLMGNNIQKNNLMNNLNMEKSIPIPPTLLIAPTSVSPGSKVARPFKAYPHDPLSLAASFTATDALLDSQSAEKYSEFRKRMIEQIYAANGGQPTISNPKMRRNNNPIKIPTSALDSMEATMTSTCSSADSTNSTPTKSFPQSTTPSNCDLSIDLGNGKVLRDNAYFERRKKNNAAAKKSRDRRRIKEDEIAIRAAFLERENIELKFELAAARKQLALYGITRS
uniref:Giant protein n=1 Tax=Clogmia albipunctata TaxID=85120 RepID=D7PBJ3_CLOAL|nr:giant protein [Clogmia albipunctata]